MKFNQKKEKHTEKEDDEFIDNGFGIILFLSSLPLALIIGRWLPQIILPLGEEGFDLHFFVAFIISYIILKILFSPFKKLLGMIGIVGLIVLIIMLIQKDITLAELKSNFFKGISGVTNNDFGGKSMDNQIAIEIAIKDDYGVDKVVEDFLTTENLATCLPESTIASFALFVKISCNWNYKKDPPYRELFRPVSETINTLTGDCDDHAICLATSMKKTGARTRVVHTNGHLYPELLVGKVSDYDAIIECIRSNFPSSKGKKIHMTKDAGLLWLSMDYTNCYPGSRHLGTYKLETLELK